MPSTSCLVAGFSCSRHALPLKVGAVFYADLLLQSDDLTSDTGKRGIFPLSGTVFSVSSGRIPFYGLVYLTLKSDKEYACLKELEAHLAVLETFLFPFCFFQHHLTEYGHSHAFV